MVEIRRRVSLQSSATASDESTKMQKRDCDAVSRDESSKMQKRDCDAAAEEPARLPSDLDKLGRDAVSVILLRSSLKSIYTASRVSKIVFRVISENPFWEQKCLRDFPDVIEMVGASLPKWVTEGTANFYELQPWRRYYLCLRWFMKMLVKMLVFLINNVQPVLVQEGKIPDYHTRVGLEVSEMDPTRIQIYTYDADGSKSPTAAVEMSVREVCSTYLATFPTIFSASSRTEIEYGLQSPSEINVVRTFVRAFLLLSKLSGSLRTMHFWPENTTFWPFVFWVIDCRPFLAGVKSVLGQQRTIPVFDTFWTEDLVKFFRSRSNLQIPPADYSDDQEAPWNAADPILQSTIFLRQSFDYYLFPRPISGMVPVLDVKARHKALKRQYYPPLNAAANASIFTQGSTILEAPVCSQCRAREATKQCSQCKTAVYCSHECAAQAWTRGNHARECGR